MAAGELTISNGLAFDESHGRLYLADTALFVVDMFDLDPTAASSPSVGASWTSPRPGSGPTG